MPMPERELAELMADDLKSCGYVDPVLGGLVAERLRTHLEANKDRRGLKDNELGPLVNAVRDNVASVCASQQLRGRIASGLAHKLREMGLSWDGPTSTTVTDVSKST